MMICFDARVCGRILGLCAFMVGICGSSGRATDQNVQVEPVDWYARYDAKYGTGTIKPLDRSALPFWSFGEYVRADLSAWRASGDRKWVERADQRIVALLDEMRDTPDWFEQYWNGYADGYAGWGTTKYTGVYDEYLCHDGFAGAAILMFVEEVTSDPGLRETYGAAASRYFGTIEKEILGKWKARWKERSIEVDGEIPPAVQFVNNHRTKNPGWSQTLREWGGWNVMPHNQYLAFGTLCLLHSRLASRFPELNADPETVEFTKKAAEEMAAHFKSCWNPPGEKNTAVWLYWEGGRAEDESHANVAVEFVVKARSEGVVFTGEDLKRLTNTFLEIVWNGNSGNPEFRPYLDPSINSQAKRPPRLTRWMTLASVDSRVGDVIARFFEAEESDPPIETLARLAELQSRKTEAATNVSGDK